MRIKFLIPLFYVTILFPINDSFGQKKVVIMGSSTAAGSGATTYQLSWAGRLEGYFNKNAGDGLDTIFYNIARGGYTTYQELPSSFSPPLGRPAPDPLYNVTKALSFNPDVVIVNLPSNDVGDGFSITETMDNFRQMYNTITASGAQCYIATTQPRNDYSILQRQSLLVMSDSINAQFGFFAINFWEDLVTSDGLNMLRDDRRDLADAIHPNDLGHDFLFQKVRNKNIFEITILPLTITGFGAQVKNDVANINWHMTQEVSNTLFEIERSANGKDFETVVNQYVKEARQISDYSAIDKNPLPAKSFYRIKVTGPSHSFYSNTISLTNKTSTLNITKLYKENTTSNLIVEIRVQKNENLLITIINTAGVIMQQKKQYLSMPSGRLILPVSNLATGQYFIKIGTDDNNYSIRSFLNY